MIQLNLTISQLTSSNTELNQKINQINLEIKKLSSENDQLS